MRLLRGKKNKIIQQTESALAQLVASTFPPRINLGGFFDSVDLEEEEKRMFLGFWWFSHVPAPNSSVDFPFTLQYRGFQLSFSSRLVARSRA